VERLLTTDDVAVILGVSVRTIRRLVASGQLRPVYVGRLPRFTEAEIQAYCSAAFRRAA
jgi:excisionase family DNA binding protein